MILIAGVKIVISFNMKSPFIFCDKLSYFEMMDKISKLNFWEITNSYMPGYPLLVTPFYAMPSTPNMAYHFVLIFNSILGTLSYAIIFFLCRNIWNIEYKVSVVMAVLVSLTSSLYAYNFTVMSETCLTLFYMLFFILFCDVVWNKKRKNLRRGFGLALF